MRGGNAERSHDRVSDETPRRSPVLGQHRRRQTEVPLERAVPSLGIHRTGERDRLGFRA
jgi:hypothetical protein